MQLAIGVQDVIQAIADHAFVASEFPVIISIEQHCCALQRVRQAQIMSEVLGDQLLRPPWDDLAVLSSIFVLNPVVVSGSELGASIVVQGNP